MSELLQLLPKFFIQLSGAPGSGKSTVARLLRPAIMGVIIDHDVLRSDVLECGAIPFAHAAKQAYHLQWAVAQDMMKQGFSVIVDSTCNYPEVVAHGSALAAQHGYTYWYIECKVQDIDVLDQRLRTRKPMASQRSGVDIPPATAGSSRAGENAHALFTKWIENSCRPNDNVVILDSTEDPERLRDRILKQIVG